MCLLRKMDELDLLADFEDGNWYVLFNTSDGDLTDFGSDAYAEIPEYVVEMGIQRFVPPLQVLLAVFGNAMTVLVMLRMRDRVHFMCSYLAIIAVTDSVVVMLISGNAWLRRMTGHDYLHQYLNQSEICCKVVTFLKHLCLHLTAWVMVTVAIENLVVNLRPLSITHVKSQRVTDVMCLLLVLVTCLNLHYFWTYGLLNVEFEFGFDNIVRQKYCFFQTKNLKGETHGTDGYIWVSLDHAFVDYLPMIMIISCLILTHLALAGRLGLSPRDYRPSWDKGFLDANAFVTLTSRTLLALGWTMPVTCLPSLVYFHLNARYNTDSNNGSAQNWVLASAILGEWKMLFYSCKFFVYLATCQKVRQESLEVLSPVTRRLHALYLHLSAVCSRLRDLPSGISRVQQEDNTIVDQVEAFV